MARTPSERELAAILIGHGIVDFVTGGRLTKIERNALWKVLKKLGPPAARGAITSLPRLAGTAVAGARFITMRHPYVTAAVVTYEVVKNRQQIADLAREGWEVIEDTGQAMAPIMRTEFERLMTEGPRPSPGRVPPGFLGLPKPKRRITKFNSAIKAGMAVVKRSPSYGGKGKIKPATTVFSIVTKLASAKKKKKKAPKSGIRRKIWNAMKGLR